MYKSLAGKVALITGSSSGIGASTAVAFARQGCHVSITGRNAEKLKEIEDQCKAHGVKVATCIGSVEDREHLKNLVATTIKTLGPINYLVNNAGMSPGAHVDLTKGEMPAYDSTFNVNTRSVVELTQLCLDSLKETKGAIVNISSVGALIAVPPALFYGMAKAAIDYFTKTIALDLAPHGIRVNGLNPAAVRTSFSARARNIPQEAAEKMYDQMDKAHPIGRCGQPEEVADLILFLCSDNASFISGQMVAIDGGVSRTNIFGMLPTGQK